MDTNSTLSQHATVQSISVMESISADRCQGGEFRRSQLQTQIQLIRLITACMSVIQDPVQILSQSGTDTHNHTEMNHSMIAEMVLDNKTHAKYSSGAQNHRILVTFVTF